MVSLGSFRSLSGMLLICVFQLGCAGLMYYPEKQRVFASPEKLGLSHEEVFFESEDHQKLHAWWLPARQNGKTSETGAKATVVFFHGNAENLTSHFMQLAWITEQGYNLFIFDYPGYGQSAGKPNPESCVHSGVAALKWVNANKDSRPLIVYGQSMGGAIAMRTVVDTKQNIPIRAFVIDSSFPSFQGIARHKLSMHWLTWLFQPLAYLVLSDKWAPKDLNTLQPIPVLVIHGQADYTVEPRFGEEIFARLSEPKEIWRIENGRHGDVYWNHEKKYRKKLVEWIEAKK